jgi:ribosome-associated heat shock protein Hsp15
LSDERLLLKKSSFETESDDIINFAKKLKTFMPTNELVRIDKWLWAVRIYKTRTQAGAECLKGRVLLNGMPVKPSHVIKIGEIFLVKKPPVIHTFRVKDILKSRVSAQIAKDFVEDLTSDEELSKREIARMGSNFQRDPGTGRPTKRDRRKIVKITVH